MSGPPSTAGNYIMRPVWVMSCGAHRASSDTYPGAAGGGSIVWNCTGSGKELNTWGSVPGSQAGSRPALSPGVLISSFCLLFAIQRLRGGRDPGWSLSRSLDHRSQSCRHDECLDLNPQLLLQTLASQAAGEMHLRTEGQANPLGAGQQSPGVGSLSFFIARLCDSSCRLTN